MISKLSDNLRILFDYFTPKNAIQFEIKCRTTFRQPLISILYCNSFHKIQTTLKFLLWFCQVGCTVDFEFFLWRSVSFRMVWVCVVCARRDSTCILYVLCILLFREGGGWGISRVIGWSEREIHVLFCSV